jgi:UDP-3-O-[3-hydroxymyristoyl] glucosamine N-acyltransferase
MATINEFLLYFQKNGLKIIDINADPDKEIIGPKNIHEAAHDNITFLNKKYENEIDNILKSTKSRLIIVEMDLLSKVMNTNILKNVVLIGSENPKNDLINAVNHFFPQNAGTPTIDPSSRIHQNCKIGSNTSIGPNVVIEEDVKIGENCEIEANTVIKKGTLIGNNVRIKSCTVIGGYGFGYDKSENEIEYQFLPHFGKVIIEDNVDIGSNTCLDRGSLSDTIIRKGVKIDNLVHIAHNVDIGENSLIIACSMVAGSVIIGENCWIAPAASIRNGIKIGKNSTVGLGSVLTNDIGDNKTVLGVPAVDIEEFKTLRKHQKDIIKSSQ